MKYLRTFIIVCLLTFTAFPAIAQNVDFTVDGFGYVITSTTDLTVEVVEGPNQTVVTVPSTVVFNKRTFRVTGIGSEAFRDSYNLESINMPFITYIPNGYYNRIYGEVHGVFSGCKNLSQVNMPVATSIGDYAFSDCDALTSVTLPAATSIGSDAFSNCDALTSVTLPVATSIGGYAFYNCGSLTSVTLPAATSIGKYAFYGCVALTSVTLPVATSIGDNAFQNCNALTSVTLPVATSIGHEAFINCKALTSVTLPAATSIGESAFYGCQSLSDIYVGSDPADCFSSPFDKSPFDKVTYATATLHVPAGCASKYKAAEYWKQFNFILEDYDPTGIKNINAEKVKVLCDNGNVNITGLKNGEKVEFYSVNGQLLGVSVANGGAVSINTTEHIVICKMAGARIKVLVK